MLVVALTAVAIEVSATGRKGTVRMAVAIYCTYVTKGNLMFDVNECERCACEVKNAGSLCMDCMVSVPMFEQSTAFDTVLDMLIQAEEDAVWNPVSLADFAG